MGVEGGTRGERGKGARSMEIGGGGEVVRQAGKKRGNRCPGRACSADSLASGRSAAW